MGASAFSIETLSSGSALIPDIIRLADRYSKYLGFFPKAAWAEQAAKGHIFVATDRERERLLGYLLYYVASGRAVIQQLCVSEDAREWGVGKALVKNLSARTRHLRGISLHCARDFPAHAFWSTVGFDKKSEKRGRGKKRRWLTHFWMKHEHPTLFPDVDLEDKQTVVMDANVFFEHIGDDRGSDPGTSVLSVPWLEEQVRLRVTRELLQEIERKDDDRQRQRAFHWAQQFEPVGADHGKLQRAQKQVAEVLGTPTKPQQHSDVAHLGTTIAAGISFFVTHDRKILSKSETLAAKFGLRVMDPVTLLTHFDEQRSAWEYEPGRLGGSHIHRRRPRAEDLTRLVDTFHHSTSTERKHELRERVHHIMKNPDQVYASLVEETEKTEIAMICGERFSDRLVLPCLRCLGHPLAPTVIRHLISEAIVDCRGRSIPLIEVSEPQLDKVNIRALRDLGFVHCNNDTWLKVNICGAMTLSEADARLNELGDRVDQVTHAVTVRFQDALQRARSTSLPGEYLLWLEMQLSPLRLLDERLQNWIVPIQPRWAQELFDYELAKDSLLPTDPDLALRYENVYYRSARHGLHPRAPGHVLWYVSSSGEHGGPSAIRACSNIEDVVIDTPNRLYAEHERLGVYKLSDLRDISGKTERVLAFRFSGSELFAEQIVRKEFSALCRQFKVKEPPLSKPWQMPTEMFAEIYRRGTDKLYANKVGVPTNTPDRDPG